MALTLDQKIAEAERKLAQLRSKARANDTRQKIIVGAIAISAALKSRDAARSLLGAIESEPLRDHDKSAVSGLVERLRSMTTYRENANASTPDQQAS